MQNVLQCITSAGRPAVLCLSVTHCHMMLVQSAGISGASAVPLLHLPSHDCSPLDSQRLTLASSRQSSSAQALASSAASQAAAPSASALRASRGSLVMQLSHHSQLTQAVLSELALQQPEAPPAAMQHSFPSSTAFRQGLDLQNMSGDARKHRGKAVSSAACESGPGGKRRKKKGRHAVDPAMDHVEDQLQILKHVHVKHASPT